MTKCKLLLCAFLFGITLQTWAQTRQLQGVVLEAGDLPLPGASILVKGTTTGVSTDKDGKFSISVGQGTQTLVVSFIGYIPREVPITASNNYTIMLDTDATGLEEVVVIGYGAVKRNDLTGAVASLSAENLTEQRKTDIGQAMQGRVAGVDARALSTKPGAPISFKIRGNTVISNQNAERDGVSDNLAADLSQPLFVVDGIFFNDINILNPADIDQIDILKDASATAIYGARGANGVIIITTKNGIEGRTQITYDGTFGVRSAVNKPDFFNGPEYLEFVEGLVRSRDWKGTNLSVADYNNINPDLSTEIRTTNDEASNAASGRFTNWGDDYLNTAIQTSHNIGISGGADGLVYSGSAGYLKDEGLVGIEAFERYNLSASLTKKVSNKLTIGLKTYLTYSDREEGSRELLRSTFRLPPTVNSLDASGNVILFPDDQDLRFTNPFYDANGAWLVNTKTMAVIANAFINYKPTQWLSLKTQIAPNIGNTRFGEFRGLYTKAARNDPSRIQSHYDSFFNTSYTWDNIADMNFNIGGEQSLKATLISSLYYNQREFSQIETRDFDTDAYTFYNTESGTNIRDYDTQYYKETLASFAGRINYSIQDKYLFTFTGRYDGSSKLAVSNKWAFFPSAAFAWKISDEDFLQGSNWISSMKIRTSYGESGNDSPVSAYSSLAFLGGADYLFGNNITNGVFSNGLPNYDLTWERSKEFNFGLDVSMFQNKVGMTLELYNKTTVGSIFNRDLLAISGYSSAIGNFGSVENSGIELTLNTKNIRRQDFLWSTSFNFARNRNRILELDGDLDFFIPNSPNGRTRHQIYKVGEAVDAIYAFEVQGIWQLDEVDEAAAFGQFPGEYRFVDQNNDGIITNEDDRVVLGSSSPDWIAGMTNTFDYKNFSFSFQLFTRQGTFGHSEFLQNFVPWQGDDAKFNKLDLDYWTPNNPDAENPALEYGANVDYYYTDFDFVKVGNIGFGYQLPKSVVERMNVSNLRLSLNLQNPFIFTDYAGPDPETGLQNSYNGAYSVQTILFGLNLTF
jgi:TonB-linked SusC/RagA family outer membrane protein